MGFQRSSAKSTDRGNDLMVAQFAFLFLARAIFQETPEEMDVKTVNGMEKTNREQFYMVYLTNRFHVAVRLFSNRSQMTSKCAKNKELAQEPQVSVWLDCSRICAS